MTTPQASPIPSPGSGASPVGINALVSASPNVPEAAPVVLPLVDVIPAEADTSSLRATLAELATHLECSEAYEALQADHAVLQREYRIMRERVDHLDRELREAAAAASPFVRFCQQKYDALRSELESANLRIAEYVDALTQRKENRGKIQDLRERLRLERQMHEEDVQELQLQIDDLRQRISDLQAVAPSAPSPDSTQRLSSLESELASVQSDYATSTADLEQSRATIRALEASQQALEDASSQLRRQVETLERRTTELRDKADTQASQHRVQLERSDQERDRLRAEVDRLTQGNQVARAELLRAEASRDQSEPALRSTRSQVAAARGAIDRLERSVNDLAVDRSEMQRLQREVADRTTTLAAARTECARRVDERDAAIRERDALRRRVAGLVTWTQPSPPFSGSTSNTRRRRRSPSPSPTPRRSRRRLIRHGRRSHSPARRSPSNDGNRSPVTGDASNAGPGFDGGPVSEDSEDDVRAALACDRAALRRHRQASSLRGTSSRPIQLSDSADSSSSGYSPSSGSSTSKTSSSSDHNGRQPSNGPPEADQIGDPSDAGSNVDPDDEQTRNTLLTDSELALLPTTVVPRREWLPGYRVLRHYHAADVEPWPLHDVLSASVLTMTVDTLFHQFAAPAGWMYPLRSRVPVPSAGQWSSELVDEANVTALMAERPWLVLDAPVTPRSFDTPDTFDLLVRAYTVFENEHRQSFWESTHSIPIPVALQQRSPFFTQLYIGRKQRRSRAGVRWKSFLRVVLRGMIAGLWDLDILLDPFFLHFPRTGSLADYCEPWPLHDVLSASVLTMTVDTLFHQFAAPAGWMYPLRSRVPVPSAGQWSSELVDEANVTALMAERPWLVLDAPVTPRSFDTPDTFDLLVRAYTVFENEHRQSFWESTHSIPIPVALQQRSPFFAQLYIGRKQRRSRAGVRWKSFLRVVLRGMIAGLWDLDILLDPFFLHFPRSSERTSWYPGFGMNPRPATLVEALRAVDRADHWRNQYRDHPADHPGRQIRRLDGKFRTSNS